MTPQEIDARVELLAEQGASVHNIVAFLQSEQIPSDIAVKTASAWVDYYKVKSLPAFDGHKMLNQEISRLNEMFEQLGSEVLDPKKLWTMIDDWSAGTTENLLMYWREEYEPMEFPTGTRVRRVEPENYVSGSGSMQYGEIIVNHFRYLLEQNPYQDSIPPRTEEQMIRLKFLGGLHMVQWYDKNGEKVCITFSRSDQIVRVPEPE